MISLSLYKFEKNFIEMILCFSCMISRVYDIDVFRTGDVNFDQLVKVVSATVLHCDVIVFPFITVRLL